MNSRGIFGDNKDIILIGLVGVDYGNIVLKKIILTLVKHPSGIADDFIVAGGHFGRNKKIPSSQSRF